MRGELQGAAIFLPLLPHDANTGNFQIAGAVERKLDTKLERSCHERT